MRLLGSTVSVDEFGHCSGKYDVVKPHEATFKNLSNESHSDEERDGGLPGISGISTENSTSRPSPSSARSATNLNLPKFMFAPLTTTANRLPAPIRLFSTMYCFNPARASAPAGSVIDRVSIGVDSAEGFHQKAAPTVEDILDGGADGIIVNLDDAVHPLLT